MTQLIKAGLLATAVAGLAMPAHARDEDQRRGQRGESRPDNRGPSGGGNSRSDYYERQGYNGEQGQQAQRAPRPEAPAQARPDRQEPQAQARPDRQEPQAQARPDRQNGQGRDWNNDRGRDGDRDRDRARDGNGRGDWADRDRERRDWNDRDRGRDWYGDRRDWNDRSGGRDWRYTPGRRVENRWDGGRRWDDRWRNDRRYDWQDWKRRYTYRYHLPAYRVPYGWSRGYFRFSIGVYISNILFSSTYWIDDPYFYRLPPAYGPLRWIRYYDDALLVDIRDGYVVDVVHGVFR